MELTDGAAGVGLQEQDEQGNTTKQYKSAPAI